MIELNRIYNEDCLEGMKRIPDGSVDCILTDPPYLYLKNQKLDRVFDEQLFFSECKRVLKKDGFIVLFGRGTSFYRWNTILAGIGFTFKEEIIWDKRYCSSPVMTISRVHETVSIHTLGEGTIKKVKIPYLEMKGHDIDAIISDIKRLSSALKNTKSFDEIVDYLKANKKYLDAKRVDKYTVSIQPGTSQMSRTAAAMSAIREGMKEKTIIRTDYKEVERPNNVATRHNLSVGNRGCNVMQSIAYGMNEKTIIKQPRDQYKTIHPTQKPVRLLERLLNIVCNEGDTILDPFSGSASTAIACINTNRSYIGFEIDKDFYEKSIQRISEYQK